MRPGEVGEVLGTRDCPQLSAVVYDNNWWTRETSPETTQS